MADNIKTAIVTGGCSGIGLGLVRHLLSHPSQKWRVVLADIRPEAYAAISSTLDKDRHLFIETDVGSWDSQASLFRQACTYSNNRIDFFAANAGTAEREHITLGNPAAPDDVDGEPTQPPMLCTQVNQIGVFYGLKLFLHYTRRTAKTLKTESASSSGTKSNAFTPKMVITSSCSALYPFPVAPEYSSTKHAVLGLTRALGPLLLATDNIGLNCIMPAYVNTNLTPSEVTNLWPKEWITPISTMVRAYEELSSPTGSVSADGKSNGAPDKVKAGCAVECVVDKLFYRDPVEYADESQKFLIDQNLDVQDGIWWKGMRIMMEKGRQLGEGNDSGNAKQTQPAVSA